MSLPLPMLQWLQSLENSSIIRSLSLPLLVFASFLLFLLWFNQVWATEKSNLPPCPPRLPIIGHLHYLDSLLHRSLQALSRKYGPLMLIQLGFTPTLVVSSAEMAREVMKTHDVVFSSRPLVKASRIYMHNYSDIVFTPYSEYWRQMRMICAINIFSTKRVQHFRYITHEETMIMVNEIKELCSLKNAFNLSDIILVVTNNIASHDTVGRNLVRKEWAKLMKEMVDHFGPFNFEDLFPSLGWIDWITGINQKMKKTSKEVHSFKDEVIEGRLSPTADGNNLIDVLLQCQKDPALGIELTRENIRSVVLDIFGAGTEPSYTTIEWAMAELVSHPKAMNKVQVEVRRVAGKKPKLDDDDINRMDYLKCVVKEALRLHPPLTLCIPRESTESANINGYHIPAKTRVLINLWAISRDPEIWDRPNEFFRRGLQKVQLILRARTLSSLHSELVEGVVLE